MKTTEDLPSRPAATPAEIVDLAAVRARKAAPKASAPTRRGWVQWSALIACIAVGVILARGLGVIDAAPMIGDRHGALIAQGALAQALDQQVGGADVKAPVRIGVSFQTADKTYCRAFQVSQGGELAGLACRTPAGWQVRMVAVPAMAATLGAVQKAAIDGAPLDTRAEAAAKAKGWRP